MIIVWPVTMLKTCICCCFSVAKFCPTLCNPMDFSMPGFPVFHYLPEFAQAHGHWVSDAIQPSHPLWSPSPPAFNLSQHQGLFQWVCSLHQVAKVLGVSASASVLPMNIQSWFPLRISYQITILLKAQSGPDGKRSPRWEWGSPWGLPGYLGL